MSRYIERDYIGSTVSHLPTEILQTEHGIELIVPVTDVIEIIKNAPSVNIVRCGECRYRIDDDSFVSGHICLKRRANGGAFCEDDDFCSYGKVR